MSNMNVQQLLSQMRALEAQAKGAGMEIGLPETGNAKTDFSQVLKASIESVNQTSMEAGKMADAYENGDPNVTTAQMMIALEKASVSFQAMTQVRNRLLSAYQDIMNMPV